ncbi:MAG: TonB-dependent receptor [Caulobacteraceae bacterium]|nr:TonB-dependent receptor [Caulobacteraceae bacterium]
MSIEDLGDIIVSSVTRSDEAISQSPAAIFVITHDDIARSGARTLPEMLRLAPNLEVAQTSASKYVITARGFSGNPDAQNFANKLLVLIDGRSVYTPLYSGVYWDMQDVPADQIDRIEVISGPGATLWGANAVNGVINIITRKADDTQGLKLQADGGDRMTGVTLQYGGKLGPDAQFRVYAKQQDFADSETLAGANPHDGWSRPQAGFRLDWEASDRDSVSLEGDAYKAREAEGAAEENIFGRNLTGRWSRSLAEGGELQVGAYYDRAKRRTQGGGGQVTLDTYNLDLQHSFSLGRRQQVVWGGGVRRSAYDIQSAVTPSSSLSFTPPSRNLDLTNFFAQDSVRLASDWTLILGLKVENDPYTKAAALPSARLSWTPSDRTLVWAAASRAIRAATPFDRDVVEVLGGTTFLVGGGNFDSEKVNAYELGVRLQPTSRASFSVSTYYNVYDDLRSIETDPITRFLPLRWGNGMKAETRGLEAWGDYELASWWRLSAAYSLMQQDASFKPGSSGLFGVGQLGNDPKQQAQLKSSISLRNGVTLDAALRYVGKRPSPVVRAYYELNARLGWAITDQIEFSVTGQNLLHDRHQEMPASQASAVPRSVIAGLNLRF